jgi:hypothetical protein
MNTNENHGGPQVKTLSSRGGVTAGRSAVFPPPPLGDGPRRPSEAEPGQYWRRVFSGQAVRLRELRCWLTTVLPDGCPRNDVITIAVEFGTNAIKHTESGQNGFFAVEVAWLALPSVMRVAVADGGAAHGPKILAPDELAEHGHGLPLVRALAVRTGVCGDHHGRLVWADIACGNRKAAL